MKIIWCDDKSDQPGELPTFQREWFVESSEFLAAKNDAEVLVHLKDAADLRLLVMDLLFDQPEDETVVPLGIIYLDRIRQHYPDLMVVTRSVVSKPGMFGPLYQHFVRIKIRDHFSSYDTHAYSKFRRGVLIETIRRTVAVGSGSPRNKTLREYVGDQWGIVLFADISGFTSMTEQLWHQNRDALCDALTKFYDTCVQVVQKHNGVVDKFIGDELMALFFVDNKDHKHLVADSAVAAAIALTNRFRDLSHQFKEALSESIDEFVEVSWRLKIGLEAGSIRILEKELGVGNPEYCAIGHAVNMAARVKGVAGDYAVVIGPTLQRSGTRKYTMRSIEEKLELKNVSLKIAVATVAYE
ncbi:adenylate/guanylate cyclase domain-containing protein [Bradyrhizobium sp. HKCCYLRH3099]|uniref:adenylate/guanylate cyclase domain-containing protein n=1 Tax=unclassified Bradyrhizobium TaxID=2631580 RepID=UPI003EB8F868